LGIGVRVKKQNDGATGSSKKFDIFSHLYRYNTRTWRTDTGRQQRPRLLMASRGKNH